MPAEEDTFAAAGREAASKRAAQAQARIARDTARAPPDSAPAPDPAPEDLAAAATLPPIADEYEPVQTTQGTVYVRRNDFVLVAGQGPVYLRDLFAAQETPAAEAAAEAEPAPPSAPASPRSRLCENCAKRGVYVDAQGQAFEVDTPLPDAVDGVLATVVDKIADAVEDAGGEAVVDVVEETAERAGWLKRVRAKEQKANNRLADAGDTALNVPGVRQGIDVLAGAVNLHLAVGDWLKPGTQGIRVGGRGADSDRAGRDSAKRA